MTDAHLIALFSARSEDAIPALKSQYGPYCRAVASRLLFRTRNRLRAQLQEVQAFLGKNLPCVWPEDWEGQFQVVLFHTGSEVLWGIDIYSTDLSPQAEIQMELRTELWQGENASSSMGTLPGGGVTQLDSYPMANGATAELIRVTDPETVYADGTPTGFHPQHCAGYFMQDGILYVVTAFYPIPPQESTEAQLKTVLDSFPAK